MKRNLVIILYVVLLAGLGFCGWRALVGVGANEALPQADSSSTNQPTSPNSSQTATTPANGVGQRMTYGVIAFMCLVVLALAAAREISHFVAHRVEKFVFDEDLEGERSPEYDEAEKVWANGKPLEAIQLMREYLKENPAKQFVALRIAEIYEKDLGNYIAAALEYEDIIKKRLEPERWGWAAIHLSNLYSGKLNKTKEAEALLRRIIDEHPRVAAAKKARERLGEPEPPPEVLQAAQPEGANDAAKQAPSNLPPGFRPK